MIWGDCLEILPTISFADHVITDPPYSERVHKSVRSSGRNRGLVDGNGRMSPCALARSVDLGFDYLDATTRRGVARECHRIACRWSMAFADVESQHLWRLSFVAAGMEYVKTMYWVRIGGAPNFSGDGPSCGAESITLAHRRKRRGHKRWNGGGKVGVYTYPIVVNRNGHRQDRLHKTPKPAELMLDLVSDFTDPDDIILDPFCGSGTTGYAALVLGRRFIGIERDAESARTSIDRLTAVDNNSTIHHLRAGQEALFR